MAAPKLRFKNAKGAEFTSWVTSFIGDECKITTGNKDTQNKIDGGKYPFFVRSQTVERINTYSKDCEAILTSGDGVGVGKNYHYINGKFDFHQRVYCLYDFSNQLLGKYLYIYFSNYFFDRVKRLSAKNSVDSVRMDMISKMEIKLPCLDEQTKIASFLSAVDEKISQLTQKHALLSQYKQGMMQKLFSQQIRFKADDGSDFGDWDEKFLSEIGSFKNGLNKDKESFGFGYPFVNLMDVFGKKIIETEYLGLVDATPKDLGNYDLRKGDVLFIRSSVKAEGVGQTALVINDLKNVVYSGFLIRFRDSYGLDLEFKKYCFMNNEFRLRLLAKSTTSANTNINQESLSALFIKIPCLEEQSKIANFLSAINQKIEVVAQQIEQAKTWKKGLLQQMFV